MDQIQAVAILLFAVVLGVILVGEKFTKKDGGKGKADKHGKPDQGQKSGADKKKH